MISWNDGSARFVDTIVAVTIRPTIVVVGTR